jgi:hypothetical protein
VKDNNVLSFGSEVAGSDKRGAELIRLITSSGFTVSAIAHQMIYSDTFNAAFPWSEGDLALVTLEFLVFVLPKNLRSIEAKAACYGYFHCSICSAPQILLSCEGDYTGGVVHVAMNPIKLDSGYYIFGIGHDSMGRPKLTGVLCGLDFPLRVPFSPKTSWIFSREQD